jgi:CheY-like chemotaxis protein
MGGELQVSSELDKSSSFWFELSLPTTFNDENQVDHEPNGQIIGYQGRKRTILVVDDNQANCSLMSNILEPLGFKVVIAENGQEGLDLARKLQPDLILTDVFMPIKTGFVMALELRQIKGLKDIPIIALSASTLELVQEKSLLAGCAAFLPKPIDQHKLLATLGKYLHLEWITAPVQSD